MSDVLRTVGRFEIIREVGRGGMAMVWLARQTDLDRLVALKELAPFHAADPAFAARFLRESRIAGSLNHPNIVTVHDFLESDGVPFISMEYMQHGSLRPLIGTLSLAQVAYVLEGMLAALAYAEQQGIVHRDLKPENVMVRADGQVKIADFGVAKAYNQASSTSFQTMTGTTVGTPAYMAPEQAMAKELGPYTDLYSTGVMAYELLVGQVPFTDTETPVAILMRHVNDPPPAPRSVRPDLDEGIEAWLLKLLEKNPADRYQHATDAWDALEEIIVTLVGPRWRRDARVLGLGGGSYQPTPTPLPSLPKIPTPPPVSSPAPMADPFRPAKDDETPADPQVDSFEWPAFVQEEELLPPSLPEAPTPLADPFRPAAGDAPDPQVDSFEWPAFVPEAPAVAEPEPPEPMADPFRPATGDAAADPQVDSFEWPAFVPGEAAPVEADPVAVEELEEPAPIAAAGPLDPGPPADLPPARSRRPLAIGAAILALLAIGVVAAIALTGGGSSPTASTTAPPPTTAATTPTVRRTATTTKTATTAPDTTTTATATTPVVVKPLPPDPVVAAAVRPSLGGAGARLFAVSPRGHVVRLAPRTLRPIATVDDAARPRAVAMLGSELIVADDGAIARFRQGSLAPVGAQAFGPAPILGGGGSALLVAATGHRICVVGRSELGPCTHASFTPSGLGASAGRTVYAVDGAHGALRSFRVAGARLVLDGPAIPLGKRAHGPVLVVGSKAFVAVARALAVVDLATGRVTRVALRVTPGSAALVAGRIVVPLPARGGAAIVSAADPTAAPGFVATGPLAYAASAGSGSLAYVANAGNGAIAIVDVAQGTLLRRQAIPALRAAAAKPASVRGAVIEQVGSRVALTLQLGPGALAPASLKLLGTAIAKGSAAIELWQSGISSKIGRATGQGLSVTVRPSAGRLTVRLVAAAGAFTALTVARAHGGREIVVTLTPKPIVQTTTSPSTPTTTAATSSNQPGPTTAAAPPTTPPPTHSTPATTPKTTHTSTSGGNLGNF